MFSFRKKDTAPFLLQKIQNGALLQYAKEASVYDFFDTWITKRTRKILSGSWIILYENSSYIYWGKPYHKSGWSSKLWLDEFYQTDKIALFKQIPDYRQIEAHLIRVKLQDAIRDSAIEYKRVQVDGNFRAKLVATQINIKTKATIINQDDTKTNAYFYIELKTDGLLPLTIKKIDV